jgi:hypothetical protein
VSHPHSTLDPFLVHAIAWRDTPASPANTTPHLWKTLVVGQLMCGEWIRVQFIILLVNNETTNKPVNRSVRMDDLSGLVDWTNDHVAREMIMIM